VQELEPEPTPGAELEDVPPARMPPSLESAVGGADRSSALNISRRGSPAPPGTSATPSGKGRETWQKKAMLESAAEIGRLKVGENGQW
jgi:hypothetical protein